MSAAVGGGRLAMAVVVGLAMAAPSGAQAQSGPTAAVDDQWHFKGWRYMDIDNDKNGEGIELRQFNLAYNGPRVWFACSW